MIGQDESREIHFSIPQLAALWGFNETTLRDWFRDEPGVLRSAGTQRETYRIPISVAERVHRKRSNRSRQS